MFAPLKRRNGALSIMERYYFRLSLGESGRQRTSSKFHDQVLSLMSRNFRAYETYTFHVLYYGTETLAIILNKPILGL